MSLGVIALRVRMILRKALTFGPKSYWCRGFRSNHRFINAVYFRPEGQTCSEETEIKGEGPG